MSRIILFALLAASCGDDASTSADPFTSASGATSVTTATTAAATAAVGSQGDGSGTSTGATGDGSTDASTSSTTSLTTSSTSSDGGIKLDLGAPPDSSDETGDGGDACLPECATDQDGQANGDWLLHVSSANDLMTVNVADGSTVTLCKITGASGIVSLTFTRTNRLLASNGASLFELDPCTCKGSMLGVFSPGLGSIYGIAPDEGEQLLGISAQAGALVRIDGLTAKTTEIGPLGGSWGTHGATWSEAEGLVYAINGATNSLYRVDSKTGVATLVGALSAPFSTVGVEIHPATSRLYGCTAGGKFYEIDKATAKATAIGTIEGVSGCTNLGAPWGGTGVCLPIPG